MKSLLQFSGGKDSLALIYHLESLLPHLDVVMVDTGDMTDAAYLNAEIAKEMCPNFYTIHTSSIRHRTLHGDPTSKNWTECCATNIWIPMHNFIQERWYRQVIRGSKKYDPHFHGVFPGDMVDGVLYTMPLWDWTDDAVKAYLGDRCPKPYESVSGMPDCVSCPVVEACGGRDKEVWMVPKSEYKHRTLEDCNAGR